MIRLAHVEGMDPETCPAIVCCGGRMDFHGAPMARTWVKLGRTARAGDAAVTLAEPVPGWRVGDRVIVTATQRPRRERGTLRAGQGKDSMHDLHRGADHPRDRRRPSSTLDRPLELDHLGEGDYRGEVANLSRNVVVESADPDGVRGHTMYHRGSAGSIAYAEFRHLGKEGVKGKYSLHFHQVGDTMRGTSVVGASIWDSGNRWITIHGTNYLVVRDCVGYQSVGHGFFLEDGTEVDNVLDRNLAVQAFAGKPLPEPFLPFDNNSGAGFWWANSRNTFTRNVAVECDRYGFRFEATPLATTDTALKVDEPEDTPETFDLRLLVRQPDGSRQVVDIRTLPFVRFDGNEAHSAALRDQPRRGGPRRRPRREAPVHPPRHAALEQLLGLPPRLAFGPRRSDGHLQRSLRDLSAGLRPARLSGPDDPRRGRRRGLRPGRSPRGPRPAPPPEDDPGPDQADLEPDGPGPGAGPAERLGDHQGLPRALEPVDDLPPTTVITHVARSADGGLTVRGTTADNGTVRRVTVNGRSARALAPNYAEWEIALEGPAPSELSASAEDEAGNAEPRPHVLPVASR